ncbi:Uncharacterized protein TCM_013945 [Theobroma cacao]|uniref:Uncharacterized protein n=1 Tax=Theobroma cacao TaxID=3641 RepID=A0A061G460_THECC|nr:Uncharacterized protein TCM_013945 [Theobroma cacao]
MGRKLEIEDRAQVYDNLKLWVMWWANVKRPRLNISSMDLERMLNIGVVPIKIKASKTIEAWQPFPRRFVKFNVDEASKDKSGEVGIFEES